MSDVPLAQLALSGSTGALDTLFRHFDPSLMRFTSLDPIAASQNLWAYCDNNPHGAYDPDGLLFFKSGFNMWAQIFTGENEDGSAATWTDIGESVWGGNPFTGLLPDATNPFGAWNDWSKSDGIGDWAWRRTKKAPVVGGVLSGGEDFVRTIGESWTIGEQEGVGAGVGNFALRRTMSSPVPLVGSTTTAIVGATTGDWRLFGSGLAGMGDDAVVIASIALPGKMGRSSGAAPSKNLNSASTPTFTNSGRATIGPELKWEVSPPKVCHPTFRPGPFAAESIPARSSAQTFNAVERARVNAIGNSRGCHTCGSPTPRTKSGNWVPDHQPVSKVMTSTGPQSLFPQCLRCSRLQGLEAARCTYKYRKAKK